MAKVNGWLMDAEQYQGRNSFLKVGRPAFIGMEISCLMKWQNIIEKINPLMYQK